MEAGSQGGRLFDAYARRSAVAEASPDAVDVSDLDLARRIVEEEQERLGVTDARNDAMGDATDVLAPSE